MRRIADLYPGEATGVANRLHGLLSRVDEQTVTNPGAEAAEAAALVVPSLAGSLTALLDQRKPLAGRIQELLDAHPRSKVLLCLARRRAGVLFAMLRDGSSYEPQLVPAITPQI